ncbi:winged helix-turn-helix transcriptional regulator [Saccharibacillus brassicae]|uniref:Helix-turn-helix transcriptional regulator n=1 Tax=Saccharibacillus brassicae TaxID=2583377 RepID=A0A4Y6V010_SACBS|nr:helix-turn-helix domain-containing protein [Saccharibacillus brassicae]QDH21941.1 helix-turn-helix transcriptional regulator [Saccharibacillus brassicae]
MELRTLDSCSSCPVEFTVNLIGGKWKLLVLYQLMTRETVRFNELQRLLGSVTHRTLTRQLRELEQDGLINRAVYPEVPPKVEYSLTSKGKSLTSILLHLQDWGLEHMDEPAAE